MAAKINTLVAALLVLTALASNDSKINTDQVKKKITIDPQAAKDIADVFEEAIGDEEPMMQEEEVKADPSHKKSLITSASQQNHFVKTNLRVNSQKVMAKNAHKGQTMDPIQAIASLMPHGSTSGTWASDFQKDVSSLVLGLATDKLTGTDFADTVQKISDLIENKMMPQVTDAHAIDQAQLNEYAQVIHTCYETKEEELIAVNGFRDQYNLNVITGWEAVDPPAGYSGAHKACRDAESGKFREIQPCRDEYSTRKTEKEGACDEYLAAKNQYGESVNNQAIVSKQASEDVEVYLQRVTAAVCGTCVQGETEISVGGYHGMLYEVKTKRENCELKISEMMEKADECKQIDHDWHKRRSECDTIQGQMEGAACNWQTGWKGICETYTTCYTNSHNTYEAKRIYVEGAVDGSTTGEEEARKTEWRGLQTMKCLIDAFIVPAGETTITSEEIEFCKNQTHSTDHLDIVYPDRNATHPFPASTCEHGQLFPYTSEWKAAEFDPLPADAQGLVDEYTCAGLTETSITPRAGSPGGCTCTLVSLEGTYNEGDTLVKCEGCLDVYSANDPNSCPVGMKIFSPRTQGDWTVLLTHSIMMASHPASPDFIVDITRATEGATASNRIPQNAEVSAGNDLPMRRKWMTSDGSPWWLQPAGTYTTDSMGGDGANYNPYCYIKVDPSSMTPCAVTQPLTADSLANGIHFAITNQASTSSQCEFHSSSYYCQTEAQTLEPNPAAENGEACTCKKLQLVGSYSAGPLIKCEKCADVSSSLQVNSCPVGTKLFAPESHEDWQTFLDSATAVRAPHWIVDVTRPQNGCGGCDEYAMNSNTPEQATWITQDGTPWWLREEAIGQPKELPASGAGSTGYLGGVPSDYKANCYLNLYSFHTAETIVYESKAPDEITASGVTPNSGNAVAANFDLADGTCKFHSSSYYCQSVRTTTTTTLPAMCNSLYTTSMCPSSHLREGQHAIACNGNPCEDGPDDASCCLPKAKCNSLPFQAAWCPSGVLAANQEVLECEKSTCVDGPADQAICCEALTCATYNCTTTDWVLRSGQQSTEQGETPETTCCEATCAAYACTTEGHALRADIGTTLQGETPETTCCKAQTYVLVGGTTNYAGSFIHDLGMYNIQTRAEALDRWDEVKVAVQGSCAQPGISTVAGGLYISNGELSGYNHGGEALCWDPTVSGCSAACDLMADDGCAGFEFGLHVGDNPGNMCGFFTDTPTEGNNDPTQHCNNGCTRETYVPEA